MRIRELAMLGLGLALAIPGITHAGDVGYYYYQCGSFGGDAPSAIEQAGHSPVVLTALEAASLDGLDALVVERCLTIPTAKPNLLNADVLAAVANGMTLVYYEGDMTSFQPAWLPRGSEIVVASQYNTNIDLAAHSPIASGPGGTLSNSSLDSFIGSASGYASVIPGDAHALLTNGPNASQAVAFAYPYGQGQVVFNAMWISQALMGGSAQNTQGSAGKRVYFVNVLARALGRDRFTTCASEGYTGTKLTWCKNICENDLTGATLDIWIHRWINRYRDLPYCAAEGGGEEEPPQET
jgi:hypothetical protein